MATGRGRERGGGGGGEGRGRGWERGGGEGGGDGKGMGKGGEGKGMGRGGGGEGEGWRDFKAFASAITSKHISTWTVPLKDKSLSLFVMYKVDSPLTHMCVRTPW